MNLQYNFGSRDPAVSKGYQHLLWQVQQNHSSLKLYTTTVTKALHGQRFPLPHYFQSGPETALNNPNFFKGPKALGRPVGAHMGIFFSFKEEHKMKTFVPGRSYGLRTRSYSIFKGN